MKMFQYRGSSPNFGDDLNAWLWPRLIPDLLDDDASIRFIGIGSVLYDNFDPAALKVVFGSGYGGYSKPPRLDDSWFIYFVRGPRTASTLGLDPGAGLGDSGILIRAVPPPAVAKRYKVAFIPHYDGMTYGAWPAAAAQAGQHLIDPRWPVDVVLDHLLASERVICEAMHGAIIADALRIPWVAVQPIMAVNQPKWQDWADSLGIALRVATLAPSSWLEHVRRRFEGDRARLRWISYQGLKLHGRLNGFWIRDAAATLSGAARQEPQLSGDATIARVTERMIDKTRELRAGRHLVRAAA